MLWSVSPNIVPLESMVVLRSHQRSLTRVLLASVLIFVADIVRESRY